MLIFYCILQEFLGFVLLDLSFSFNKEDIAGFELEENVDEVLKLKVEEQKLGNKEDLKQEKRR